MRVSLWKEILIHEYQVWNLKPDFVTMKRFENASLGELSNSQREQLLRSVIEELSDGDNTVFFDEEGYPSVMVRLPLLRACDLLDGEKSNLPHPAFRMGMREIPEIWVGKYLTSLCDGHPVSLPMTAPHRFRSYAEAARVACGKGRSWQMMPHQVRMAIALNCLRNGIIPGGNNDKGRDFFHPEEQGELLENDYLVRTGSGAFRWTHNGLPSGIWDLNGNLNEWESGLRLVDGEIQVMTMQSLYKGMETWSQDSPLWQAFDSCCQLQPAGGEKTLHYEATDDGIRLIAGSGASDLANCAYQHIRCGGEIKPNSEMKLWGLLPADPEEKRVLGWRWVLPQGETLPLSGGAYLAVDHAGVFFTGITKPRSLDYPLAGMRLLYIAPEYLEEE